MSNPCCDPAVLNNPCAAIADGRLHIGNYAKYGLSKAQWMLLTAQCGTTSAVDDLAPILNQILACCDLSLIELQAINVNTVNLEARLDTQITLLTSIDADTAAILIELQAILVEVEAINDNTDTLEALLATVITLLTTIATDTTDIEVLLTTILANQIDPDLFGVQTITSGTHAVPPAGNFSSWLVVSTGATAFTVNGITLSAAKESTNASASNQSLIPAPIISTPGGETYEWRAIS